MRQVFTLLARPVSAHPLSFPLFCSASFFTTRNMRFTSTFRSAVCRKQLAPVEVVKSQIAISVKIFCYTDTYSGLIGLTQFSVYFVCQGARSGAFVQQVPCFGMQDEGRTTEAEEQRDPLNESRTQNRLTPTAS